MAVGPSTIFTEMVTTTQRWWAPELADNVSKNNALLRRMKQKGQLQTVDGGYEIALPLDYAENSTYQRYISYSELNTNASDVLTSAKYEFEQAAIHVTASGREIRMNMGSKERMIDLVAARKNNAMRTAANEMSNDIYSDGTEDNQIGGLAHIIQTNGQGTVGGIDSTNFPFWRNRFLEVPGTELPTPEVLKQSMNKLWYSLVRGMDKPDLIVSTQDFFAVFENGEQQLQRYASGEMADAGFNSIKYKSADVIFDDSVNFPVTGEKMYFVNTDYLFMKQHREASWTADDAKVPVNQDAIVVPVYWMGNLCCSNRELQGVLLNAA